MEPPPSVQSGASGVCAVAAVEPCQLVRLQMADEIVLITSDAAAAEHLVVER